ncbi:flagellar hook assembly protein FlgD [Deferribacterales bacterium Es71-Z0220]|uniref:flagellar hook assembly protein FlgD n=1 Tax=Deferrivibrio essentukiensis TaxID=2880922 RepID=UPI001F6085A4|nr:flagellar hook assembly protein FlgD [Deferrivibrio essentukiensis]MCB4204830.1 flagellar hook assembly protein FlgD [Deferrivibrio essentukiensis]
MLTSNEVSSQYGVTSSTRAEPKKELNKDDFLNLMVTQLKNQDPLNPLDNNEFISQTTQFSSLEQLINIGESIKELAESQTNGSMNNNLYSASNFIGKEVKYFSDTINLNEDGALIGYELDDIPASLSLKIIDENGNAVANIVPSSTSYGMNEINWDGLNANWDKLPNGKYKVVVDALDASGSQIPYRTYTSGIASGVSMLNGNLKFNLDSNEVSSDSIFAVYENK